MRLRLKIILESPITKAIVITIISLLLATAIILPSILTARKAGELIAFNRDATSGTREAFAEKVLGEDPDTFSPGSNVLEASNNESMIRSVKKNNYSTAYVSFGTVATFDESGNPILKDGMKGVSFSSFEGVKPTKDNIVGGSYAPQRTFNAFFRVKKGSHASEILTYDFENNKIDANVKDLSNNLKASFFFYQWALMSNEAASLIDNSAEITFPREDRIDFTKDTLNQYILNTGMSKKESRIEIVGSSSATPLIEHLASAFETEVESQYGDVVKFVFATNGSGDAFKETIPGTEEAYIGMQSREAKSSELSGWGWSEEDKTAYNPFAIDAILIIYNINAKSIEDELLYYDTTQKDMRNLYTSNSNVKFDSVFKPGGDL